MNISLFLNSRRLTFCKINEYFTYRCYKDIKSLNNLYKSCLLSVFVATGNTIPVLMSSLWQSDLYHTAKWLRLHNEAVAIYKETLTCLKGWSGFLFSFR